MRRIWSCTCSPAADTLSPDCHEPVVTVSLSGLRLQFVHNPKTNQMKALVASSVLACATVLTGCATQSTAAAPMTPGTFVTFTCEGGASFRARMAEGGGSVRVRAQHGAFELDRRGAGVYEGDGYRLLTLGPEAVSLQYQGKAQGQRCKSR